MPLLFSYGSLREPDVQIATFGRLLHGEPDELIGFEQSTFRIDDPQFVMTSGKADHAIVKFNGRDESRVRGMVFELSDAEVTKADTYEPAGYRRIRATLTSGKQAWVYADARFNFYEDLAEWWPLFSPAEHYGEEADDLLRRLGPLAPRGATLLELGSGGGSLASHLKPHFTLTLTDRSAGMLAVNRRVNPECEHHLGDMRTLRLGRQFDIVLVHDAICYATEPSSVRATLETAASHCRPGGVVAVLPDYVRETFTSGTEDGGHDASDGRGLRYLEWRWDPDPNDDTYLVDYAFMLRYASGAVSIVHDRHMEGLFARAQWLEWFDEAGLTVQSEIDQWGRDIFMARPCLSSQW